MYINIYNYIYILNNPPNPTLSRNPNPKPNPLAQTQIQPPPAVWLALPARRDLRWEVPATLDVRLGSMGIFHRWWMVNFLGDH